MNRKELILPLLHFFLLIPLLAHAQQLKVVRVGVVSEQLQQTPLVNSDIDSRRQRDQLVSYLNQNKPKSPGLKVEAVALTAQTVSGVVPDARAAKCDYIVYLQFSNLVAPQNDGPRAPTDSFDAGPVSGRSLIGFQVQNVADGDYVGGKALGGMAPNTIKLNVMSAMDEISEAVFKVASQ